MSIDAEIREKIQEYADRAPSSMGLLDAVRARSRRRRRRHRVGLAGIAIVVTASVVAVPAAWRTIADGGSSVPAASPRLILMPPAYELPSFPFTPGWTPPQSGKPIAGGSTDGMWLQFPRSGADSPELWIDVALDGPALQKATITSSHEETVQGRPATMRYGEIGAVPFAGLTWQHTDGLWVTVAGTYEAPADDVRQVAESLTATPLPILPPFTFDLVPADTEPVVVQGSKGGTLPPIMQFLSKDLRTTMAVELKTAEHTPGAQATTVGGKPAEILVDAGHVGICVFLDADRMLQVGGGVDGASFSPDDLILFAQGIHVTDEAVVGR